MVFDFHDCKMVAPSLGMISVALAGRGKSMPAESAPFNKENLAFLEALPVEFCLYLNGHNRLT